MTSREFDYIIVGAGPSAMGFLYGILESYATMNSQQQQQQSMASAASSISIAVIERGDGPPHDPLTTKPERWYEAAHNHQPPNAYGMSSNTSVRLYPSVITGRRFDVPVGQGLGGTSNINACLCMPPLPEDMEQWPMPWKESLIPASNHLQEVIYGNQSLHCGGNTSTEVNDYSIPTNCFNRLSSSSSFDAPQVSWNVPMTMVKREKKNRKSIWVRSNYYCGLLEPLLQKHSDIAKSMIHWFRGVEAQRLLFHSTKNIVTGIECWDIQDQHLFTVHATEKFILCAGAIESPALLLSSGLGRKVEGSDIHDDLKGIGENLQDQALLARAHVRLGLVCPGNSSTTDSKTRPDWQPSASTTGIAAIGHWKLKQKQQEIFQVAVTDSLSYSSILPGVASQAVRWQCSQLWQPLVERICSIAYDLTRLIIRYTPIGWILNRIVVVTLVCLMHPRSKGQVAIRPLISNEQQQDQHQNPNHVENRGSSLQRRHVEVLINPGYLHHEDDDIALKNVWTDTDYHRSSFNIGDLQFFFELFPQPIIRLIQFLLLLTTNSTTKHDIGFRGYCRSFLQPYYHFAGTCAMDSANNDDGDEYENNKSNSDSTSTGNDKNNGASWVVEAQTLRLRGYTNLHVCDASVFPSMISNPPALTCCALGYCFGKMSWQELKAKISKTSNENHGR